jgi:hypothetical protein
MKLENQKYANIILKKMPGMNSETNIKPNENKMED